MIILAPPYVSEELKDYLETTQTAVLKNDVALAAAGTRRFNFVDDAEARKRAARGERVYTTSENALEWVLKNVPDESVSRAVSAMKDKAAMRRLLQSVYPDFFFREVSAAELRALKFEELPCPVVLKPSVGFFSVGVHTIRTREDWRNALDDIEKTSSRWSELYPESVLGNGRFIIEKYIGGDEYAVDVCFDDRGNAVVLNVLKHDFASESDVSDRLYYTSKEIILENLAPLTDFFNRVNGFLGARNFPAHVELRIDGGRIVPVEFNPMRFAGWCSTDVAFFAFGLRTYDYFLNGRKPDWEKLLAGKDGTLYTMIVLNKPNPCPPVGAFDYDALCAKFERVLSMRAMDFRRLSVFGFMFTETRDRRELDFIVRSDLTEFIR